MDTSTTAKRQDDISHAPVPQAEEEHHTELTAYVTAPSSTLKSILKNNNCSPMPYYQSPQKLPATTNEFRTAMTSSPTSPESPKYRSPEHHKTRKTTTKQGTTIGQTHPQQFSPTHPWNQTSPHMRTPPDGAFKPPKKSSNTDSETQHIELHRQDQEADWLYTNQQLNESNKSNHYKSNHERTMHTDILNH